MVRGKALVISITGKEATALVLWKEAVSILCREADRLADCVSGEDSQLTKSKSNQK
jgi:hypothetical protein